MRHRLLMGAAFAAALPSCGRLGFDASTDDPVIDAAADLDAETTLGTFGAIQNVPGIASIVDQDDPSLTGDELKRG